MLVKILVSLAMVYSISAHKPFVGPGLFTPFSDHGSWYHGGFFHFGKHDDSKSSSEEHSSGEIPSLDLAISEPVHCNGPKYHLIADAPKRSFCCGGLLYKDVEDSINCCGTSIYDPRVYTCNGGAA